MPIVLKKKCGMPFDLVSQRPSSLRVGTSRAGLLLSPEFLQYLLFCSEFLE